MIHTASWAHIATARLAGMAAAFAVAFALLGTHLPARSQSVGVPALPGLPTMAKPGPAANAASAPGTATSSVSPDKERERLAGELADVRRWTNELSEAGKTAVKPAGITPDEVTQALRKLGQWSLSIEGQLRAIDGIASTRAELAAAQAFNSAWTGPGGNPPYSILVVDDWASDAEVRRTKIASMQAAIAVTELELRHLGESAKLSAAAVRSAEAALRAAKDIEAPTAAWRVQAAKWKASAEGATLAAIATERQLTLDKLAVEQAQLTLLMRKLSAVAGQVRFSAEDLAQARRIEQTRRDRLEKETVKVIATVEQRAREFDAAKRALELLRAGQPAPPQDQLDIGEARLRASRIALETARRDVETLSNLKSLSDATLEMWAWRFDALNDTSADRRREATDAMRKLLEGIRVWTAYAKGQVSLVQSGLAEQAVRQERAGLPADIGRYEAAAAESLLARALRVQELDDGINRMDRTLRRWLDDIGGAVKALPWDERAALAWSQVSALARAVGGFELFAVEDTVDVQGQKVSVSRGVTVGKSVGAALVFIVGFLLASSLARRLERKLIGRFGVGSAQARTVRRLALTLVAFLLLILTLNLAQIPLTVFAFLGGALAIGVGFGTQTIIKNFISGFILLMERHIRVGDIVDIGGTTGTVYEVNLRSSTIKGFDGIAAIVPNSTLLEGKFTNWTMTDPLVRRIVRVGVAYGSPTGEVARRMMECAQRHGLVVKNPEPQVLFEDFADNNLVFALYFWIDVKAGTSGSVVMSDLRFMIEKSFAEAGISIAFPQRDVHLDTTRPLQVELARPAR